MPDDITPEQWMDTYLSRWVPRPIPPPDQRSPHAVYARYEITDDEDVHRAPKKVAKQMRYKDILIYADPECTQFIARFPWHYSAKPTIHSRTVMLNCSRRPLYWVQSKAEKVVEALLQ